MLTKTEIQELKSKIDCRELVQSLGIKFKGTNISCLNSSHPDSNPSMAVYSDNAVCFACNYNLDAISIVQTILNVSFKEALEYLCSKYNFDFHYKNHNLSYKTRPKSLKISFPNPSLNKRNNPNIEENKILDTSIKELLWNLMKELPPTKEDV